MKRFAAALAAAVLFPGAADAALITLSANTTASLRAAVAQANLDRDLTHAYTISIASGVYVDPDLTVTRSLTLDAVVDGSVTLLGAADLPNQKGLIVASGLGTRLTVDGIVFQGAHISNALGGNGAGIRDQVTGAGSGLVVTDSSFLGNQEGILTGGSAGLESVVIRNSVFRGNGNASKNTGQEHAIYVNGAGSVLIDGVSVCGQVGQGHNFKIRSTSTRISNSQSWEGIAGGGCTNPGNASRGIDIPNGGILALTNVDLFQGPFTGNSGMLEFGVEGLPYAVNRAVLSGVDFVNTRPSAIGIQWFGGAAPCTLTNVSFSGVTTPQSPAGCTVPAPLVAAAALQEAVPVAVPEPGSLTLLASMGGAAAGVAGVVGMRRRRRN